MNVVKVRKIGRGELVVAIPKNVAKNLRAGYMSVELDTSGKITYTPVNGGV